MEFSHNHFVNIFPHHCYNMFVYDIKDRSKDVGRCTVPLNYNFIFACVYTRGSTRKLQCHPVTCLCGPHFLVACNVHVTCRNMRGTKFTHVEQKIHTITFTHLNYSPDTTRGVFNIAINLPN